MGDWDKGIEIVNCEKKRKISFSGTTNPSNQSLSFVHFESPFTSVSTITWGHPSLVSLGTNELK
jgi:hypothetical protein